MRCPGRQHLIVKAIRNESRGVQKKLQQVRPGWVFCLSAGVLGWMGRRKRREGTVDKKG